jgi:hypothetical protein
MSENDKKWSAMNLTELRSVAKKYKEFHSLGNISKAKKGDLITTLNKFMMFDGDALKQKPNAMPITMKSKAPAPKPKAPAPKPKAPAPKPKAPPAPQAPPVMTDKTYKKGVVAKKVVQARGASADAMSIAQQAKAMGHSLAEHKKMLEKEKQVQTKGKAQARRAVGDAMSIAEQAKMMMKEEDKKKIEEASSAQEVKVKDIVRAKMDDRIYYRNRYYDNDVAYGIVKNKVMIIGKAIEDYNDLEIFDKPKEISRNIRFYTDDDKPIKTLNDLQSASSAPASSAEAPKKETMEEFKKRVAEEHKKKVEEAKAKGEKYIPPTRLESLSAETKQKVNILLKVPKTRLKEGIKNIAEKMGAKLPKGILTTPMYSEDMKNKLSMTAPSLSTGGRNDKDQELMLEDAIGKNGMNLSPRSREEFMNKLFDLILSQASSAPAPAPTPAQKKESEDKIMDKLQDLRDNLFLAILDQKNINTMGKSDSYMEKISDKYNTMADDMLLKWIRKGGEELAKKEARDFIDKYTK